ncbi:DNRLRE domain-containing protein [Pyxidicoccus fallax]|uniref:DNRLRE domain-containing protein n=1 Tax=Pyxidicoccus fallax TaxID=394095 RepID=A0A848LZ23_9BACT|nr:DNRLRE domain-containing protein [Pyxidicoccus fallax]NMO23367.1 DNRLRE domain-containing protein [Pyxidicoccus fallax]NPC86476.1 DNRLRE domain-containing protein [Pyxidicoccus fallax]
MSGWKVWKHVGRVAGATAGLMLLTHCGAAGESAAPGAAPEEGTAKQEATQDSCVPVTRSFEHRVYISEDAYAVEAEPNATHEGEETLLVDGSPRMEAYLRASFDAEILQNVTLTGARLRLYATDGSTDGPALYRAGSSWSADTLTWNNRPALMGGALGDLGAVGNHTYVEYDVSSVVTAPGTYDFALIPTGGNGVDFASGERSSLEPQLILTLSWTQCERQGTGGDLAWTWTRGGADEQYLNGMAMHPQGGFVVASRYYGQTHLGGQTFTTQHGFALARYDANGAHQWSRVHVPTSFDIQVSPSSLVVTPLGNILMVGSYMGAPDFGGGPLPATAPYKYALFIAKFSPNGDFVWARGFIPSRAAGEAHVVARDLTTDANGSLIVTGHFGGALNLGGEVLRSSEDLSGSGLFLAKFSWEGEHLWSRAVPVGTNGGATWGWSVATSADGRIFVGGEAGAGRLGATQSRTPFVAAYGPEGTPLWSRAFNGSVGYVGSLAPVPGGGVAFAGQFEGSFSFAGTTITSLHGTEPWPGVDGMLGVLSPTGGDTWAKGLGDAGYETASGLASDPSGNLSVVLRTNGPVDLGGGVLGHPTQNTHAVARFTASGAHRWSRVMDSRIETLGVLAAPDGSTVAAGEFRYPITVDGTSHAPADHETDLLFLKFGP